MTSVTPSLSSCRGLPVVPSPPVEHSHHIGISDGTFSCGTPFPREVPPPSSIISSPHMGGGVPSCSALTSWSTLSFHGALPSCNVLPLCDDFPSHGPLPSEYCVLSSCDAFSSGQASYHARTHGTLSCSGTLPSTGDKILIARSPSN